MKKLASLAIISSFVFIASVHANETPTDNTTSTTPSVDSAKTKTSKVKSRSTKSKKNISNSAATTKKNKTKSATDSAQSGTEGNSTVKTMQDELLSE